MASVAGKLRNHGSVPGRGMGLFSYARCPDWFCAPLNLLNGYLVATSLSVRRTGVEDDHPHLPNNEVKSGCSCICTPSYAFKVSTRTLPLPPPLHPQTKPIRSTLLLSVVISTSLHVSGKYVPIIRRTYCIYVTLVFFTLYGWQSAVSSQPADQTATHTE